MIPAPEPRRHEPPAGWPPEIFEVVTDALAAALVAAVRRADAAAQAEAGAAGPGAEASDG